MPNVGVAAPFDIARPPGVSVAGALHALRRLRLLLAPPGSAREAALRLAYVPLIHALPRRWQGRMLATRGFRLDLIRLGEAAAPRRPIRRLLVLKLDHIGDFVIGLRALRALRDGFPDAHLTLACARWNADWARRLGWIDSVIECDFFTEMNRDWRGPSLASYDAAAAQIPGDYDLAIDLRHDADTRPCLYRVSARQRAGFLAPPEPGLPQLDLLLPTMEGVPVAGAEDISLAAEQRLDLLAAAVIDAYAPRAAHPLAGLRRPKSSRPARAYAVLAIGAGDPIRCWPLTNYAELGRALVADRDLDVVILGGTVDAADAAALAGQLPPGRARMAIGLDLAELPDLLARASLCACNGSGISHLAGALGVPTVAVLGGTTRMEVWRPAGPRALALGGRTPCQPCGLKYAEDCPWQVACLRAVTPAMVLSAVADLLGRTKAEQAAAEGMAAPDGVDAALIRVRDRPGLPVGDA